MISAPEVETVQVRLKRDGKTYKVNRAEELSLLSSANTAMLDPSWMYLGVVFCGPKMEPCNTPAATGNQSENAPSKTTCWYPFDR